MKRKLWIILALAVLIAAVWCTAGAEDYRYITKPQSGSIDPETLSFRASWETNFVPVKVVVYDKKTDGTSNRIDTLTKGLSRQGHYDYLPEKELSGGSVRVYYGSGTSDYLFASFDISLDSLKFITRPQDGSVDPNLLYCQVNWKTSFVPVKVQIGTKVGYGNYSVIATQEVYLQKEGSYNIPAMYDLKGGFVYAYYGFGKDEYVYAYFDISMANVAFKPSYQRINVDPGSTGFTVNWETTFFPVRIIVQNGDFEVIRTVTLSGQEKTGSFPLPFSGDEQKYYFTGYFGSGEKDYIFGSVTAGVVYVFSEPPRGGFVYPQDSYPISWKTNFVPDHVVIGHGGHGGSAFHTVATLTDTDKSMTYDLDYDDACTDPFWEIRAYKNSTDYVSSGYFRMEKIPHDFTSLSSSVTIYPNGSYTLRWMTNFTPNRVEIGYKINDSWNSTAVLTKNLTRWMAYLLTYNQAHEAMYIRAWYDSENYVESGQIGVDIIPRQFTVQPADGTLYPWTTHRLHWTINYFPTKFEIGYRDSRTGGWISTAGISTGLSKSMDYVLSYDEAINGDMYIRAYYGTGAGEWEASEPIRMVKHSAYVCGDNLTAALDANGVLTFAGSGAMYDYNTANLPPWFSIRASIQKIVIPDGVTRIGSTAFISCTNLSEVVMTPDVTAAGNSAFLACTSLRHVNYDGFKTQWDAIDFGDNHELRNTSVTYLFRSGQLGNTGVYYQLSGCDNSLSIYGSGGSTVHVTPPWVDVAQYITEIRADIDTLWEDAFRDCTGVKKVYLSEDLTLVEDGAFYDCTGLTDIYYNSTADDWDSIEILGRNTPLLSAELHTAPHVGQLTGDLSWSVNDEGLLRIWLDDDLMGDGEDTVIPDYDSYTATPWYADYKDVITSMRIESGVTGIGKNAFRALPHLRTISIADTVTRIENIAFASCASLEDVTLPNSIETIGANAFTNCDYLEVIHLPDSVTFLGVGAFRDCGNLEEVWLPGQLTTILDNTFMDCPLLDHIDIPAAVTVVNANAFLNCTELASPRGHVYYGGTSAQWKQISINATGNTPLRNCPNIHMTPGELRIDAAHFPDAGFRSFVSASFDTDSTGYLTDTEISGVQVIQCGALEIESLDGIGYFTELEELDCHDNLLQELDLSANTKLQKLVCSENALTELPLSALPDLYYLNCSGNQLTALDVSHQMLEALYCRDNQLTELDLSGQAPGLLDCQNNPLTLLNLSGQTQLEILSCYGTNLAALDLRGCTQLLNAIQYGTKSSTADYVQYQYVDNKLERILRLRVDAGTELIVPGMLRIDAAHFPDETFRNLIADNFDNNDSGWLSAEEIAAVQDITFEDHDFQTVQGIEFFTELETLCIAGAESLTSIDLRSNTKLTVVDVCNNGLTEIRLEGLTSLRELYICNNSLQELDVSILPELERLECDHNPRMTSLTLDMMPCLSQLYCYSTSLASLNISGAQHLIAAWLGTKDGSAAEYDRYTADGSILDADKATAIITGIPAPAFTLPAALIAIEAEAFQGIAAEAVLIPAGVTSITGDPFSGSAVRYIYGSTDLVRNFAQAYGYVFVPVRD